MSLMRCWVAPGHGCKGCASKAVAGESADFGLLLEHTHGQVSRAAERLGERTRACWRCGRSRARAWGGWCLRTAQWVAQGAVSEDAAVRLADWIEPLLRRESYLALLLERPNVHERLLRILGAARWPARYLLKYPGVIDELAGGTMLQERFVRLRV